MSRNESILHGRYYGFADVVGDLLTLKPDPMPVHRNGVAACAISRWIVDLYPIEEVLQ